MHVVLPLTKGHLSTKDRFFGRRGVSLLEGDYCTHTVDIYFVKPQSAVFLIS